MELFDEMVEKGVDIDAVSVNTAIAAAEAVGDDARAAELREGAPFKGEDENASSESDESEDGSEDGSEDDAEPDIVRELLGDREDVVLEEEDEAKRLAARKRKREEKKETFSSIQREKRGRHRHRCRRRRRRRDGEATPEGRA